MTTCDRPYSTADTYEFSLTLYDESLCTDEILEKACDKYRGWVPETTQWHGMPFDRCVIVFPNKSSRTWFLKWLKKEKHI